MRVSDWGHWRNGIRLLLLGSFGIYLPRTAPLVLHGFTWIFSKEIFEWLKFLKTAPGLQGRFWITRPFIKFIVGSSETISLCHEYWHPNVTLFLQYGYQIVYDAQNLFEVEVFRVLKDGNWIWHPARSEDLMCASKVSWAWWRLRGKTNQYWLLEKLSNLSCIGAWNSIRTKFPRVRWWKLLWFSKTIPIHTCILAQGLIDKRGITMDNGHSMYSLQVEDREQR